MIVLPLLPVKEFTEREMFERSFRRPKNFFSLSFEEQWWIDCYLGILDWEGEGLSEADRERFAAHYKDTN
jgi:hypothetical protein